MTSFSACNASWDVPPRWSPDSRLHGNHIPCPVRPGSYRTEPLWRRFPVTWAETWESADAYVGLCKSELCCFCADLSGCQRGSILKHHLLWMLGSAIAIGFGLVVDTMQGGSGIDFCFSFTNSLSSQRHPETISSSWLFVQTLHVNAFLGHLKNKTKRRWIFSSAIL